MILFLNDSCWLRCGHCWYTKEWKDHHNIKETLSFEELCEIASKLKGINFMSFAGGEAFMRDDCVKIIKMFLAKTHIRRFDIPTSGYLSDLIVGKTKELLSCNKTVPFRVNVSLDGTQNTHNSIRGSEHAFENAIETVTRLYELSQSYKNFDVGIITTVSSLNQHEIKAIAQIVRNVLPIGEWMVNIVRGNTRSPSARDITIDAYQYAGKIIQEWITNNSFSGHRGHSTAKWLSAKNVTRRKMITDIVQGKVYGGWCAAGTLAGVIQVDGSVWACESLTTPLGNLRKSNYDLAKVWINSQARKIRKHIIQSECQCTHECFLSVSLLMQPRYWPHLIRQRYRIG
jgi:MoaA/NifB/PqqE/SkfB family radical SAM enzyme